MPSSQHLKRPPMVTAGSSSSSLGVRPHEPLPRTPFSHSGSSSSSLSGMEQSVQPFQDFIKQTRAIEPHKPLPPIPLAAPEHSFDSSQYSDYRRSHLFDSPQTTAARRSSSVYSRTQSQWIPDTRSFKSLDLDSDSYLQPGIYQSNIAGVNIRKPSPDLLEPRECSPLITSPSPTLSAVSTQPKSRPPTVMLNSPLVRERPKVRMMSIDKANRAFNAPGAVHLLPEELRAQAVKISEARTYPQMDSVDVFGAPRPPPLPPAAFTFGEERSHSTSTGASVSPCSPSPRDSVQHHSGSDYLASTKSFHVGTGPVRTMAPPSQESVSSPPRRYEDDEQRGRTRERQRQSQEYANSQKLFLHDLNTRTIPEQGFDTYRQPSVSGSYDSEDDVRGHMKMIPQPLFQAKSPTQHRKPSNAGSLASLGYSPFRVQRNSQESGYSARSSGFPLSLTPPPGSPMDRESKGSTTGMIPISPPSENEPRRNPKPHPINTNHRFAPRSRSRQEAKVSSMYPRIMGRNKKNKNKKAKEVDAKPPIGAPLLPPDVVAAVLLTPETTPQTSPLASNLVLTTGLKRAPSGLSAEGKRPLYQRFKGITKLRKGSKQQELSSDTSPTASPQSPHLYASPVKAIQPAHLGWSETAKATWDQARSTAFPSRKDSSQATSPNENDGEIEESENSAASRPNLFGPFMESYRETKAQKRREDLKKMIKVVTPLEDASEAGESGDESEDDGVVQKRLSGYNWM